MDVTELLTCIVQLKLWLIFNFIVFCCFVLLQNQDLAIHSVALGTLVPIDASKFFLAIELIQFITEKPMCPQNTLNTSRALEGVHGVHVVPHSPFALEETTKDGDFPQSNNRTSIIEVNQSLLMQWVKI